jgi:hypothetical protein
MYYGGQTGLGNMGVIDHIPAQNKAGSDLAAVVSEAQGLKSNGQYDAASAQRLSASAITIADTFATWARSLHNSRADAGADQIQKLGHQIAADLLSSASLSPTPAALPPQQVQYGPTAPPSVADTAIGTAQATITRVIDDVRQGAAQVVAGPDYSVAPAAQPGILSGLPEWAVPAAIGFGLVFFLMRKK